MWVNVLKPEYSIALRERAIQDYLSRNEKCLIIARAHFEQAQQNYRNHQSLFSVSGDSLDWWLKTGTTINEDVILASAEVKKWENMETDIEKLYQTPDFKWFLNDYETNNFRPAARDYDSVWVSDVYGRNRVIRESLDPQDVPKTEEITVSARDIVNDN